MNAKDLPEIYTAREVSEAFKKMAEIFTSAQGEEEAQAYANLLVCVARGSIAVVGIRDGKFALSVPENAPWLKSPGSSCACKERIDGSLQWSATCPNHGAV